MPPAWTDGVLDALRTEGDPIADAALADYLGADADRTPRSVMTSLVRTLAPGGEEPTGLLADYLADAEALPEWADPELLRQGQEFFAVQGLYIATALFCASLPVAYASARGAQVIFITGDLVSDVHRRIAETAQLICDVMSVELAGPPDQAEHPLAPDTRGYRSARGVRLMHAAVRQFVMNDPDAAPRYDATAGVPINQEDLLGTLLTFTIVVYDALDRLGVAATAAELDAYHHTWCVVGHLIGIRPDLLPIDRAGAAALDVRIRARNTAPSAAGIALAAALTDEMARHVPRPARSLPTGLVHHLNPAAVSRALGVRRPACAGLWVLPLVVTARFQGRVPWLARPISRIAARAMIRAYVREGRRGERPPWDFGPLAAASERGRFTRRTRGSAGRAAGRAAGRVGA